MIAETKELIEPFASNGDGLSLICAPPTSMNGWPPHPFEIVSLLDMFSFDAHSFMHAMGRLQHFQRIVEVSDFWAMSDSDRAAYISWVETANTWCSMYDLDDQGSFSRLLKVLIGEVKITTPISGLILAVRSNISYQLTKHRFMYMSDAEAEYYNQQQLFGNEVNESFPDARLDISSAGNCIACGLYTASVYHSMRVAEFGLRRIAKRLRVKLADRGKAINVEYATWDKVITACHNKITETRKKPVGKKKEKLLALYSDAGDHCLFMKDIWRNNISHTRKPYNEPEAIAVLERVKDFMRFLAVNVP
jgi:hypothetical protein